MSASEIVIFGGGPAGCTAARLLALWGHRVLLVTRPLADGIGLAQSLTPSCGKFFDLLGIREAVDAAGFVHTTGNTVWWGSDTPRIERFATGATGWQVTAPRLEQVMRRAAVEAGVAVDERTITPADAASWPAQFRIDCTGRSGVLARTRAGRVQEPGHRTVALSAVWHREAAWPLPDPSHTVIESYADGWAWSVPIDARRRAVAVMVDPQTTSLARGDGARATYLAEVGKTMRLRDILTGAEQESGPAGWDAAMYHSTRYADDNWLVAGDAASFVDPLSSAGVKKALASGWLAAIVAHTSLRTPSMATTARAFFADREQDMYAGFLALTRQFLREGGGGRSHPFWDDRSEVNQPAGDVVRSPHERADVEAAYARIRSAADLRVGRGSAVQVAARPAIAGAEVVLEPRLVTPEDPQGVRFLFDVDVVSLVELAPQARQVPDLYDAYMARSGPIDLAAFLTALATAIARGWLEFSPEMGSGLPGSGPEV